MTNTVCFARNKQSEGDTNCSGQERRKTMTRREMIDLLKRFPDLSEEILFYKRMKARIEDKYSVNSTSVCDTVAMENSGVSDSTGNRAIRMSESGDGDLLRDIDGKIDELVRLRDMVVRWIEGLSGFEKSVVWYFYVDGKSWAWISGKVGYSEAQCRRIRDGCFG